MPERTGGAALEDILRALSRLRIPPVVTEYELHTLVAAALAGSGFIVRHEVSIAPRCRIDFLVGDVGIEIKSGRPARAALIRQAQRYLMSNQISALIIAVERNITLPAVICGKPVKVLGLDKLWGVALP